MILRAAFVAVLLAAAAGAGPGAAQSFGALGAAAGQGALDYARARALLPQLSRVIFEKADANGDGLISPQELPVLEGLYRTLYMDR